ncbi:hypothetical protein EZS27_002291 [termite gut metagenome]|uniref:Uncharacterized protein n=1 Tax=termite gut metagenome TaxID=433724 RepID=A0A5J4SYS8_9ZZZZ
MVPLRIEMPSKIDDNRVGSSFNYLFKIILKMELSDKDDDVIWDFSKTSKLNPFFILPLILYKKRCIKNVQYENISDELQIYFNAIHFHNILDVENMRTDFSEYMESFSNKRYIPIIRFPASKDKDELRNQIIKTINTILKKQLNLTDKIYSVLSYLLSELIDNITEHSDSIHGGYIFAQYYTKNKYIDICIADEGITILGSYVKAGNKDIINDVDAIKKASTGVSTKNLPEAENRGYGIRTSKKMLAGLKGQFFLFSGGAFYRKTHDSEDYVKLPKHIKWDGTVVLLRIPYGVNEEFNIYEYLEG